ncbi:hypothetical protein [Streptomyces sp. NPDC001536]|uniref:hypothetical protein n=1 Tax=Streptomyces sp. NPDC001536 TaxID=3364583 RepID=UPI003686F7A1
MAEAEFVQGMTPFLRESLGVYGDGVLTGEAAVGASGTAAEVGRGLLRATYRRVDERGREGLSEAVQEASAEPGNEDALGVLRQEIRRALRNHPELERELAALLPNGGTTTVIASGDRSIAAGGNIGVAITGDGHGSSKR